MNYQTYDTAAGPELLDSVEVAAMLGCSKRHVHRLRDGGLMPPPIKLGQIARWRKVEVLEWISDGCRPVRPAKGGRP